MIAPNPPWARRARYGISSGEMRPLSRLEYVVIGATMKPFFSSRLPSVIGWRRGSKERVYARLGLIVTAELIIFEGQPSLKSSISSTLLAARNSTQLPMATSKIHAPLAWIFKDSHKLRVESRLWRWSLAKKCNNDSRSGSCQGCSLLLTILVLKSSIYFAFFSSSRV